MRHRPAGPPPLGRRALLRGLAGAATLAAVSGPAGCGTDRRGDPGLVTMGSNRANPAQREAIAESLALWEADSGVRVELNTIDSTSFQESLNNYLQGTPDDVVAWFAGYRMRHLAERGLISDATGVWEERGFHDVFTDQVRDLCSGPDGRQYMVPDSTSPWAVFYRRSVFEEHGYEEPSTKEEFIGLCERMRDDGLVPLAYGVREGWPAMGTFDHLNLRLNGPEFHLGLLNGDHPWDGPEVKAVFGAWKELLPYHQASPLGRGINEAQTSLVRGEAGMMLCGLFLTHVFSEEDLADLDCFAFPEFDAEIGADVVETPIDGFMLSGDPRNPGAATDLVGHLGTLRAQEIYTAIDPQALPTHQRADLSELSALDAKIMDMIAGAGALTQYMDRDTRPDFASVVMIPALQRFLRRPDDIDDLTAGIQRQKASIFGR